MDSAIAAVGPPPSAPELRVEIGDAEVAAFREQGFLAVERLTTDEEVAWLARVWDALFADRRAWFDVSQPFGAATEARLGQLLFPETRAPALRETLAFRNARRIAAHLLGADEAALGSWGHMILKPARHGEPTPWHQDEAYWEPDFDYHALGTWLPLEDVDGENGCMCFLPGSHRDGVRAHRHVGGDPAVHLLELAAPLDARARVEVPLRAGGATFHDRRTLHATAGNRSARPRRAWANEFQTPPRRRAERAERPWLDAEKEAWGRRGASGVR
jgi:ectoine hydroxylase-related dioxygenase (phytanoyl-CoA dioxygenase family)